MQQYGNNKIYTNNNDLKVSLEYQRTRPDDKGLELCCMLWKYRLLRRQSVEVASFEQHTKLIMIFSLDKIMLLFYNIWQHIGNTYKLL